MEYKGFHWEYDQWYWERIHLEELWKMLRIESITWLPKWTFIVPDKLSHFATCFVLTWIFFGLGCNRHIAALIAFFLMMGPWEIVMDGCFRYGASWKDMVANTLGCLICWWWLDTYNIVGQSQL
jgi:hypothetical protein